MDDLLHADIFFFVTTIAVVVVGLAFTVVLIYLIVILRRIKRISEEVHQETILFREDVHALRDSIRREGFKLKTLFSFVGNFFDKPKAKRSKKE